MPSLAKETPGVFDKMKAGEFTFDHRCTIKRGFKCDFDPSVDCLTKTVKVANVHSVDKNFDPQTSENTKVVGVTRANRKRAEYCVKRTVSEERTHRVLGQTR